MHKRSLITSIACCLTLLAAACSRTDRTAPATPAGGAVQAPTAVVVTAPEDRLEPASIENARLPNGSALPVETPAEADKNKSRP